MLTAATQRRSFGTRAPIPKHAPSSAVWPRSPASAVSGGQLSLSYPSVANTSWYAPAWSPELGIYCCVALSGAVMTSPDGVTWTTQSSLTAGNIWCSIAWSSQLRRFVVISQSAGRAAVSPDGVRWTEYAQTSTTDLTPMCYAPEINNGRGLFIAHGLTGSNLVRTSPDGERWSVWPSAAQQIWSLAWSPELRLVVGVGQSGAIVYSRDGCSWKLISAPANRWWFSICWSSMRRIFVAVAYNYGTDTNAIMTSPDGLSWTMRKAPVINFWRGVCWSDELRTFVASCDTSGTSLAFSTDGISWTSQTTTITGSRRLLCASPKLRQILVMTEANTATLIRGPG